MNRRTYYKKDLVLREGQELNVAADTEGARDKTASKTVTDTIAKTPNATKVTVPADEINGNSSDSTTTVQVDANPNGYKKAEQIARKLGSDASTTNFEFVREGVTFTKKELSDFLINL